VCNVNNSKCAFLPIVLILAGAVFFSSCHSSKTPAQKRYPFTGRIVSIDTPSQTAIIDGANIPGFMDPMTMTYKIKPAVTLNHLSPGDSISAEVVVVEPAAKSDAAVSDYWLENVKVVAHGKVSHASADNSFHAPAPGEDIPNFSFVNQNGKRISLQQYRGKVLLLTFIYTRCPFPDFCPRVSSNFAEIYRQFATNPALARTRLLSISFDPEHDTPKVLRDYAFSVAHTHDPALFSRWQFAAPSAADLPRIAAFFALTVQPENGTITHNLSTAVIGPDGKIVKWYHGGDWQPSDLIRDAVGKSTTAVGTGATAVGKGTTSVMPQPQIDETQTDENAL
jgi:protein SCO1/2